MTTLAWGWNANSISPRRLVVENKRFSIKHGIIPVRKPAARRLCSLTQSWLGPPRRGGLSSCRNWSRENWLCCEEWRLERLEEEKKKGGGGGEWCGAGASGGGGGGGGEVCGGIFLHAA